MKKEKYSFLTEEFIEENADILNWDFVSTYFNIGSISWEFIKKFSEQFNWSIISSRHNLSQDFIVFFQNYLNWDEVSLHQKLDPETIKLFDDKINIYQLVFNKNIGEIYRISLYKKKILSEITA